MSGVALTLVGLFLCFAGTWSLRLAISAAGFGVSWIVAEAFGASTVTTIVVAVSGALVTLVVTLVMSRFLFFLAGGIVGAVLGARLWVLLDQGEASVVLAVFFIPAMAVAFGVLANRLRGRFMAWATAFGGAALVISGLGIMAPEMLGELRDPQTTLQGVVSTTAWIALAVFGRAVQRATSKET